MSTRPAPSARTFRAALCLTAIAAIHAAAPAACCLPLGCMEMSASDCATLGGAYIAGACTLNDGDGDGVRDECDFCPDDPSKIRSGACGCAATDHPFNAEPGPALGSRGAELGFFNRPHRIDVDAAGRMYVADTHNSRVQVLDPGGTVVRLIGGPGSDFGRFRNPADVAVDNAGRILVADDLNARVQVFDRHGNYLFAFGSPGSGPGQFNRPRGIDVDAAGRIYVVESLNHRVQVFDSAGGFLFMFGGNGKQIGQFSFPCAVHVDHRGRIYVIDIGPHRLQVFDHRGEPLLAFGNNFIPTLHSASDIAVDAAGRMYIAQPETRRIAVFHESGAALFDFGFDDLVFPNGIALDATGNIYVADLLAHTVRLFTPVGPDGAAPGCLNASCPWDFMPLPIGNGVVNIDELHALILAFGGPGHLINGDVSPVNSDGTIGNGVINTDDLLEVLSHFGACPLE